MDEVPSVSSPVAVDPACMPSSELIKAIMKQREDGGSCCTVRHRLKPADEVELLAKGYRCKAGCASVNIQEAIIYTLIEWPPAGG